MSSHKSHVPSCSRRAHCALALWLVTVSGSEHSVSRVPTYSICAVICAGARRSPHPMRTTRYAICTARYLIQCTSFGFGCVLTYGFASKRAERTRNRRKAASHRVRSGVQYSVHLHSSSTYYYCTMCSRCVPAVSRCRVRPESRLRDLHVMSRARRHTYSTQSTNATRDTRQLSCSCLHETLACQSGAHDRSCTLPGALGTLTQLMLGEARTYRWCQASTTSKFSWPSQCHTSLSRAGRPTKPLQPRLRRGGRTSDAAQRSADGNGTHTPSARRHPCS